MAIAYPVTMPAPVGPREVQWRAVSAVAADRSPFTFRGQVFEYPGQMWAADVRLPPMERRRAEAWVAFLLSLHGPAGSFLMGQAGVAPMGTATGGTLTGAAGSSSPTAAMTGTLETGDWLQVGGGAGARLHKAVVARSGSGTLEIWPALRATLAAAPFTVAGAQGVFRLAGSETAWSVDEAIHYGLSFACEEAL